MYSQFFIKYKIFLFKKLIKREVPNIFHETNSIFTHIPKAAGISVSSALYGGQVGHVPVDLYRTILSNGAFKSFYKFTIVRNPYDRVRSAYEFLAKGGMSEYKQDLRFKKNVIDEYTSFEDFILNWLTPSNRYEYIHFFPQKYFLTGNSGDIIVDDIFKLENIEIDFKKITTKLGIDIDLPVSNKTCYDKKLNVSPLVKEKIEYVYADDFKLLKY